MKYVRIEVAKERMEMKEKSVPIVVFANYSGQEESLVYAPKSRIIVEKQYEDGVVKMPRVVILVPAWVFAKAALNPLDADRFLEFVER